MIKYRISFLISFLLFASPCLAGMGIGGFPYPGPGGLVGGGGGSCSTQSLLVDWSGAFSSNSVNLDAATKSISTSFVGNGKPIKSITVKTGGDVGSSTTANLFINTSRDFSGTNIATSTAATPGIVQTEMVFTFSTPVETISGTTYYIGVNGALTWGTRFGLTLTTTNTAGYYYSTDGLDGPYTASGSSTNLWLKVAVCED